MFDGLPFFDYFAFPTTTLDELGAIAEEAVDGSGARTHVESGPA